MKSVAIINGSKKWDGLTNGPLAIYYILKKAGYPTKWYQIVDSRKVDDYFVGDESFKGINLPSYTISNGLNRLLFVKKQASKIGEDFIFLSDPTLINLFEDHTNLIMRFNDFRPLTDFNDRIFTGMMYRYLLSKLRKSDIGVFTTNHMKREAMKFGINPKRKFIIPEPCKETRNARLHIQESIEKIKQGTLTLTYIATDRPYKNLDLFLRLSDYFRNSKTVKFLLVSRLGSKHSKLVKKVYTNVKVLEGLSSMDQVYGLTDVLVYPSKYEGFGRPIIEAMSYGIPVIASNIEPIIEITTGHAHLCNTQNFGEWIDAVNSMRVINHYTSLAESSLKRFADFSPKTFETKVKDMFNELTGT